MNRYEAITTATTLASTGVAGYAANKARQWRHAALHDHLTGLLNRRGLEGRMQRRRWLGGITKPVGVLKLDITAQKAANDTLGHHEGDLLIQRVANLASAGAREHDLVARTGGDELTVVLRDQPRRLSTLVHCLIHHDSERRQPNHAPADVAAAAQMRIAAHTEAMLDENPQWRALGVNVAVGAGVIDEAAASSYLDMYKQADEAMYTHKAAQHAAAGTQPR